MLRIVWRWSAAQKSDMRTSHDTEVHQNSTRFWLHQFVKTRKLQTLQQYRLYASMGNWRMDTGKKQRMRIPGFK